MEGQATSVVIAYDGSELSKAAVRHTASLFPGRAAVVATVWEPGLASMSMDPPEALGVGSMPPDPATVEAVDRTEREHASSIAEGGVQLARSLGLEARAHVVPDQVDVAD